MCCYSFLGEAVNGNYVLENAPVIMLGAYFDPGVQEACTYKVLARLHEWKVFCGPFGNCPGWGIFNKGVGPGRVIFKPHFANTIPAVEENIIPAQHQQIPGRRRFRQWNWRILPIIGLMGEKISKARVICRLREQRCQGTIFPCPPWKRLLIRHHIDEADECLSGMVHFLAKENPR